MTAIAREVGVSVGTVSRVLQEDPSLRISQARRQEILSAKERLGGLRERRTKPRLTRIIVAPINRLCSRQWLDEQLAGNPLHHNFQEGLKNKGFQLYFSFVDHERMASEVERLIDTRQSCDGILILGGICGQRMGQLLNDAHFPHISPDWQARRFGINTIHVERSEGWREAIAQLKQLGHRHIGFFGIEGSPFYPAFVSAALAEEIALDESLNVWFERPPQMKLNFFHAQEAMQKQLNRPAGATAFICQDDETALGAARAMSSRGLTPGRDISLVGFGNIEPRDQSSEPFLTTLDNPLARQGRRMAELLLNQILYKQTQLVHEQLPAPLIVRSSIGPCVPTAGKSNSNAN